MLPAKFTRTFIFVVLGLLLIASLLLLHEPTRRTYVDPYTGILFDDGGVQEDYLADKSPVKLAPEPLPAVHGNVIMGKLGNETAKQALGRATWKLMHTMTLRFPESPTDDERAALDSYFHLQARLYPCGECAAEFQQLLKKFPPQTSSRRAAALWLCHVHNQVNLRLKKAEFDCAHLDDTYDCGCGDAPILEKTSDSTSVHEGGVDSMERDKDDLTGAGLIKGGRH